MCEACGAWGRFETTEKVALFQLHFFTNYPPFFGNEETHREIYFLCGFLRIITQLGTT
jgi:hypothetical protein